VVSNPTLKLRVEAPRPITPKPSIYAHHHRIVNQSVPQSVHQSISQSVSQSISQSFNRPSSRSHITPRNLLIPILTIATPLPQTTLHIPLIPPAPPWLRFTPFVLTPIPPLPQLHRRRLLKALPNLNILLQLLKHVEVGRKVRGAHARGTKLEDGDAEHNKDQRQPPERVAAKAMTDLLCISTSLGRWS
jgi:hypothetical protein